MGVCRFEHPTHHRIDIKYYPLEQYAWALLYFTGSGEFNRQLRLFAMKNGLQLSDHGVVRKPYKGVVWHNDLKPCLT
jgi:DNA polymerase/3'-5' exonuclease PolX